MEIFTSNADVDAFLAQQGPRWILKHSATCSISHAAKAEYDSFLASHGDIPAAMVVVQDHRPVSNYIAEVLGKVHQSPQAFLVDEGKVIWTATHWSITEQAMAEAGV